MSGKEYRTITDVKGPLVFLEKTEPVAYGEIVQLRLTDGSMKNGQVLDTSDDMVVVQVFEGTAGVDLGTGVKFMGDVFKLPVSKDLIGRILDGAGRPRDGGPAIVAEGEADIIGAAIQSAVEQSQQPLPPETLVALHNHLPSNTTLRDNTISALTRSISQDTVPEWGEKTAKALREQLNDSRYPITTSVHDDGFCEIS